MLGLLRGVPLLSSADDVSPALAAQPLCELPVAGYLTDDAGAPLEGTLDLELRFYADAAPESAPSEVFLQVATQLQEILG